MRIPPSSTTTSPFSSSNTLFRDVATAPCRSGAAEETSTAFPEISLPLPVEVDRRFGITVFPPAPEMLLLLLLLLLLSIDRSGAEIDSRTAFPAAPETLLLAIDGERKFALLSFLAPWMLPFPPCRSVSEISTAFPAAAPEMLVARRRSGAENFLLLSFLAPYMLLLLAIEVERKLLRLSFLHIR
jgi:hypothetical protein